MTYERILTSKESVLSRQCARSVNSSRFPQDRFPSRRRQQLSAQLDQSVAHGLATLLIFTAYNTSNPPLVIRCLRALLLYIPAAFARKGETQKKTTPALWLVAQSAVSDHAPVITNTLTQWCYKKILQPHSLSYVLVMRWTCERPILFPKILETWNEALCLSRQQAKRVLMGYPGSSRCQIGLGLCVLTNRS